MLVWPEVTSLETGWTWLFEVASLRYVRLGVFASTGAPNKFGLYVEPYTFLLGHSTVRLCAQSRRLHRVAYLRCCADPAAHLDGYDFSDSDNLCVPTSIHAADPVTVAPTTFGRYQSGPAQTIQHQWTARLAEGKRHWDAYSKSHGLRPQTSHIERWRI
jgi:hypothetical protein